MYPFRSHRKEWNAANAGLRLVAKRISPSVRLPETCTSVHYAGQDREVQLTSFPIVESKFYSSGSVESISAELKAPQPRGLVNKLAKEDDSDSCLPSTSTEDLSEAESSNLETKEACTDNNYLVGVKTKTAKQRKLNSPNTNC